MSCAECILCGAQGGRAGGRGCSCQRCGGGRVGVKDDGNEIVMLLGGVGGTDRKV